MSCEAVMSAIFPKLQMKMEAASTPRVAALQRKIMTFLQPDQRVGMHHHIKSLWHRDLIDRVLEGNPEKVTPVTVEFVPSLDCNFSCSTCTYKEWKARTIADIGKRQMSYEVMMTLLDQIEEAGVRGVIFTGGGEPFMNRYTLDGLTYAGSKKLRVGLFTNASLLNAEKVDRLADAGIGFVRVSFNSGDQDNYLRFHGISNPRLFVRAKENIRLLAKALMGKETNFGLGMIVNETNVDYMHTVAEFVRQIFEEEGAVKIAYVAYRPVVNYGQINTNLTRQIVPEVAGKALRGFERVKQILDGLPVTPILAADYFIDASEGKIELKREYSGCLGHPWAASIAYDGGAYLCSERDGNPDFLMGNLVTQTWEEIWSSTQRQEAISRIGVCPPTCKIHRTNLLLTALTSEGNLTTAEVAELQAFLDVIRGAGDPGGISFI